MALEIKDVNIIAHLARIEIDENDISGYKDNLSNILNLADQMNAVDTSNVEPLAHPLDAVQRLRPDEVTEENQREHFQSIAPNTTDGFYLVPKVID